MVSQIRWSDIQRFCQLSWRLAIVGFKLRNEGSYLGNFWYLINPALLFFILFFIFFDRLGGEIASYPAYLMIGILLFNFFLRTTTESTRVILDSGFIKSINFPREALVCSVVIRNILSHLFEASVFFVALFFLGIPLYGFLLYLLVLVFLSVFVYGVSLFLSAVAVYVVDMGNIWQFFTTLLWFATPIFYSIEGQSRLFALNLFNPPFYFITAARDMVVYAKLPEPWVLLGVVLYPLLSLIVGTIVFAKLKNKFAELM